MDQIGVLTKFKDELMEYSDFSEINYETTYVSIFEYIFGKDSRFSGKARHIVSGWDIKGAADVAHGSISDEQFNHNKHDAYLSLLDEAISFKKMEALLMEKASDEGTGAVIKNCAYRLNTADHKMQRQFLPGARRSDRRFFGD